MRNIPYTLHEFIKHAGIKHGNYFNTFGVTYTYMNTYTEEDCISVEDHEKMKQTMQGLLDNSDNSTAADCQGDICM